MKKYFILLGAVILFAACNNGTPVEEANNTDQTTVEANLVAIQSIQAKGGEFLDKEIQTQGIVDHVCRHSGKKILLVGDGVRLHVMAEKRFDESIVGKELVISGIVREDRTDEAYLLKMEEDAINSHSEGEEAEIRQENMIKYINTMRDSLESAGVDHFSEYYLDYVSHTEVE